MKTNDWLYTELTSTIIGCAMRVHSHFGLGFPEVIYKRSLQLELKNAGVDFKSEFQKDIFYDGNYIGQRRLDLLVEDKVLIELKAVTDLQENARHQLLNYLRIFDLEVGLLLNFGKKSLEFKRFANYGNRLNQSDPEKSA